MSILVGNNGANTLEGSDTDDTILGQGGTDLLRGLGGDDVLNGGNGGDEILAGSGNDTVDGGRGNDLVVHGVAENLGSIDNYTGGKGVDTLRLDITGVHFTGDLVSDILALEYAIREMEEEDTFVFDALGLSIHGFEAFELVDNGAPSHIRLLPRVFDDLFSIGETGSGNGFNVLANDSADTLVEINGSAGNVDMELSGSVGGRFVIDETGAVAFDTAGEFEHLSQGETATTEVSYGVEVVGVRGKIDLVLTQDLSGSFSNDLPNLRTQFSGLYDDLMVRGNDVGFGVASFVDKPVLPFGFDGHGDYTFQTELAVSTDETAVQAALDGLVTRNGGDIPEAQLIALQQIALRSDGEVGFRDDARRVVVLQTDAPFHAAGDAVWLPGDDGDTDIDEAEDYPTIASVGALLRAHEIDVVFAVTEDVEEDYEDLLELLDVGGAVVELSSDSSNLSRVVQLGLDSLVTVEAATLSVTVEGENDAPTALDDEAATHDGAQVFVDVLANDSDADGGDALTVLSVSDDALGAVTVIANGVIYDPSDAFAALEVGAQAVDSFTYTVSDGHGGTDTGAVTITVDGANLAPVAADDAADIGANADATPIAVLENDSDPDGNALALLGISTSALLGRAEIDPNDATRILYDPDGAFAGLSGDDTATETLGYTVTDGAGGTASATVTITVSAGNGAPVAVADAASVRQGETVTVAVLANDSDPDGGTLVLTGATDGAAGTTAVHADGTISYTPDPAFAGPSDSFTYTVSDGAGGTATGEVAVSVAPNLAPFFGEPVIFFFSEDDPAGMQVVALDVEADPLAFSIAGTGDDDALFGIDTDTGVISFLAPPDVGAPGDADGNNRYDIDVSVSDGLSTTTRAVEIIVLGEDRNTAPHVTDVAAMNGIFSIGGSFADNSRNLFVTTTAIAGEVAQIFAADADVSDSFVFRLFGEDAAHFDLGEEDGMLSLHDPLINPRGSFDGDAVYELDIVVEDQSGAVGTAEIDFLLITAA